MTGETQIITPGASAAAPRTRTRKQAVQDEIAAVRPRPRRDPAIWGIYAFLIFVSIVELFSASSREIVGGNILGPISRHAFLLFIGFIIMICLQRIHYRHFYRWTYVIVGLSVLSVFYTMFFGVVINGARRAFSLFGLCTVQPSELIKFSAALIIARLLCNYRVHYKKGLIEEYKRYNHRLVAVVAGIVLFFGALLIKQGMTNTLLMMVISTAMMIIGGVRWKELFCVWGVYAVIAGGYYFVKYSDVGEKMFGTEQAEGMSDAEAIASGREFDRQATHKNRISNFLRPDKYKDKITSDNAQEMYSFIAQANGGVVGRFPGNSRETARLPLAFSDYIYAIIIEDTGLIGGAFLLFAYLCLLWRAGYIASQCKKAFPALLVIGMAVFIVCQALVHMGIVTGCLPVSGQPLPLISKGGSSVIVTSIALGMMLSVSRFALRKGQRQEANDRIARLSDDDAMPDNPTQI
ncbi:MAG: FtsW/RodA/SpoVE family cell cycle protein [Muribaculaceae bacterium]